MMNGELVGFQVKSKSTEADGLVQWVELRLAVPATKEALELASAQGMAVKVKIEQTQGEMLPR